MVGKIATEPAQVNAISWAEAGIIRLQNPQTVAEKHIYALARHLKADVLIKTRDFTVWECAASPAKPEFGTGAKIRIAPLYLKFSELITLHELGHLACDHRLKRGEASELRCEREAWEWALDHLRTGLTDEDRMMIATVMARRAWCSIVEDGHPVPGAQDPAWSLIRVSDNLDLEMLGERGEWFREDMEDQGLAPDHMEPQDLVTWLQAYTAPPESRVTSAG